MSRLIKKWLLVALTPLFISLSTHADDHQSSTGPEQPVGKVLFILSSASLQTQGMAMVLGNALSDQGADVHVLLCDQAADLALASYQGSPLKPKDLTPGQMLRRLMSQGASVKVCALYLPNSQYTQADLLEGVGVATPVEMAAQMRDPEFRIFSF
ncbi:MAG: hypothetical protein ACRBBM_18400 [Pseudomonadaceae bacterium]|jgi:predicted peroxiredoxin